MSQDKTKDAARQVSGSKKEVEPSDNPVCTDPTQCPTKKQTSLLFTLPKAQEYQVQVICSVHPQGCPHLVTQDQEQKAA